MAEENAKESSAIETPSMDSRLSDLPSVTSAVASEPPTPSAAAVMDEASFQTPPTPITPASRLRIQEDAERRWSAGARDEAALELEVRPLVGDAHHVVGHSCCHTLRCNQSREGLVE